MLRAPLSLLLIVTALPALASEAVVPGEVLSASATDYQTNLSLCSHEEGCSLGVGCCDCCGCCDPVWEGRTSVVFLRRESPDSLTFITQPGGADALNFDQFNFDFDPGLDVSLTRRLGCRHGLELRYLGVWDASDNLRVGPFPAGSVSYNTTPPTTGFFSNGTFINAAYDSELHSGEVNFLSQCGQCLRVFGGFRYLSLREGFLADFDFASAPNVEVTIRSRARNDLYGFQLGADANLFETCDRRFKAVAVAKGGVYHADSSNTQSARELNPGITNFNRTGTATDDGAAFVGEVSLSGSYQVRRNVSLQAGYQLLWISEVALASDQIHASGNVFTPNSTVRIDNSGDVFFHGFTAGLTVNF